MLWGGGGGVIWVKGSILNMLALSLHVVLTRQICPWKNSSAESDAENPMTNPQPRGVIAPEKIYH